MATKRNGSLSKYMMLHNGNRLKKGYHNSNKEIWSAGNIVTYVADGVSYPEEKENGANCLSPTSFVPTKSGCTFMGWCEDASGNILTEKVMDSDPIILYAVFKYDDPAMEEQSHQYDREGNTYGETYDDAPYYLDLTMPATAGSMEVTAYGYSGPSECIYVNGVELKEDGVWRNIGTYTANTSVKIIYGYAIGCRVVFHKTYVGKTIVG